MLICILARNGKSIVQCVNGSIARNLTKIFKCQENESILKRVCFEISKNGTWPQLVVFEDKNIQNKNNHQTNSKIL